MDVTDSPRTKVYKGTGISPVGSETTQMALAHQHLVTAFCECHSVDPDAHRLLPLQNLRIKRRAHTSLVMYITDETASTANYREQ